MPGRLVGLVSGAWPVAEEQYLVGRVEYVDAEEAGVGALEVPQRLSVLVRQHLLHHLHTHTSAAPTLDSPGDRQTRTIRGDKRRLVGLLSAAP